MAKHILLTIFIASFFAFCGCCYGMYWRFKSNAKARADVDAENAQVKVRIESLEWAQNEALYGGKGREGEKKLAQTVERIMESLGVIWTTNEVLEIPYAILLPDGNDPFSKEIDFVLLCDLGLFVFEVKDWNGTWRESDDPKFIETVRPNGEVDKRPAPLYKTQRKLATLIQRFGRHVPCEALVVFTDDASSLSAKLPAQYMHISELSYYFRAKRDERKTVTDVVGNISALENCFDPDSMAMHSHMLRLTPSNDLIKGYQDRHAELSKLKKRPHLGYPEPGKYGFWVKAMILCIVINYISHALATIAYFR